MNSRPSQFPFVPKNRYPFSSPPHFFPPTPPLGGFFAKNSLRLSSSHLTSSLLSPGPASITPFISKPTSQQNQSEGVNNSPPAQCPQIEGNTFNSPIPGLISSTSISESSGAIIIGKNIISKPSNQNPHSILFSSLRGCLRDWFEELTKIQIRLCRQHQSFRFYPFHGRFEVAVVGLLLRDVAALPGLQHGEHVFGV
jgi:hypothetical protein